MFSTVISGGLHGIESYLMRVEVDVSQGLPCFSMVGFLSGEVKEAGERVRVALKNSGVKLPPMRITVNLSPAGIRKEGTAVDLPVAVGIMICLGVLPPAAAENAMIAGELGLNGEVRPVRGILPMVREARRQGCARCVVPAANAAEGAVIRGLDVYGVSTLREAAACLTGGEGGGFSPCRTDVDSLFAGGGRGKGDFADINGQETVKRAAEVAAAGFHHLLMIGPPGSGKTMLAKRIPGILPPLSLEESLEVSSIYSVAGMLDEAQSLVVERPFLSPHHTASVQALTGGGNIPRPGAVSLAHRGVLFLDELTEFRRAALDALRQPLEDREVHIARSQASYAFPAEFILVGAMNPCPCGYYPDRNRCRCTASEIRRYLNRVSGPILDRIDICVEAPQVEFQYLLGKKRGVNADSASVRRRVMAARAIQEERYRGTNIRFNAEIPAGEIDRYCPLGTKEKRLLENLFRAMGLSARACHRVVRVARTVADLDEDPRIREKHLAEAACYRTTDAAYWEREEDNA